MTLNQLAPEGQFFAHRLPLQGKSDFAGLLALWQSKRRDGSLLPTRRDFDPLELRRLLPRIALIDVLPEPRSFRFRLAGTALYEIHETELTGRSLSELRPEPYMESVLSDLNELVDRQEPQLVRLGFENASGAPRAFQVLRLPLASDGRTVDVVMVLTDFGREWPERAG